MMGSSIYSRSVSAALVLIVCGAVATARAQQTGGGLDVVQVRPNFYMIAGAGGNIGVQIRISCLVLVDARREGASDRVLAAIRNLTERPIRIIVHHGPVV